MARKPKCQICGQEIDKENDAWVKNSTGYFHTKCKDARDDLRKHRVVSCIICGKKIDRKNEDYIQVLGGYAHPDCDISSVAAAASEGTVKTYKCYLCNQAILKDKVVKRGDRNFHEACLVEYEDRLALFDYCCKIWGLKAPGPLITKQAKNFRDKGYTYKGMMFTLKYFYEVKHNDPNKFKGNETIGIIPYVYEEAKQFYSTLSDQKKEIATQLIEQQKQMVETRKIKLQQKSKKPKYDF